jgi:hypothetical protein
MTDYTRYEPGNDEYGRLAIYCIDCDDTLTKPLWTEDDSAEQITPVSIANFIAICDEHEIRHAADAVGGQVVAYMNEHHPDPDGGKWRHVVMDGEPR